MWKWIGIVLLSVSPLYAQCPNGCPINITDLPPVVQPAQHDYGYVAQEGHLRCVVRIVGVEKPGTLWKGSGTYVNYEGLYCVVTASHVVRGTSKLFVIFKGSNSFTTQAAILSDDPVNDCAVLGLFQHPTNAEEIVGSVAYKNDCADLENTLLENCGFGGDDVLSAGHGKITKYARPSEGFPQSWARISSTCRFGDSGGPVFLPSGKLVGIVWGKSNTDIITVRCAYVHEQLRIAKSKVAVEELTAQLIQPRPLPPPPRKLAPVLPLKPPVLPWRDKIENEINNLKKAPKVAPPNVDIDIKPSPKPIPSPIVTPKPEEKSPANDIRVKLIVLAVALSIIVGAVAGIAVQWKKKYYTT